MLAAGVGLLLVFRLEVVMVMLVGCACALPLVLTAPVRK
jgi:hypothetical protein